MSKQVDIKELKTRIETKTKELEKAKKGLKDYFVGLDDIIDSVFRNIEAWYILPEVVTRPTIVNLWGMTGVGKTDLVRRLVKSLNFTDKFLEVQLTTKGSSNYWVSSVEYILSGSTLEPEKPGILLLDEIQRFRTISSKGEEIHDCKFQDVWTLLSDGKFSNDAKRKNRIYELIFDTLYAEDQYEEEDEEKDEAIDQINEAIDGAGSDSNNKKKKKKPKDRKFQRSYYDAKRLKDLTRRKEPIEEIMGWSSEKKLDILQECLDSNYVFEGEDYSKLLIFVSGNLDEAFHMSGQSSNADIDADVFHEHSKRITFITIKNALKERFKPEQIARFGNTHLIYPSLSSKSYKEIIKRRSRIITEGVKTSFDIDVDITDQFYGSLYRNGVFPAQGTRPLFSTITSMLENNIPQYLLFAISQDANRVVLDYYNDKIVGKIEKESKELPYIGEIDKIKKGQDLDNITITAVHEAGHAVVYAVLLGLSPTQICAGSTSEDNEGFTGLHALSGSKSDFLKMIATLMAGKAAEVMFFGETRSTSGVQGDLQQATVKAAYMVRDFGMYNTKTQVSIPYNTNDRYLSYKNYNVEETNTIIENAIEEQYKLASSILQETRLLLHATIDYLIEHKDMKPEKFVEICSEYEVNATVESAQKVVSLPYHRLYKENI